MKIYLSGEIHTDWRDQIVEGCKAKGLPVSFLTPVTEHAASDNVGVEILGSEPNTFWKDHKAAKINAVRIRHGLQQADLVVIKFGEQYRQWNAAFDAGQCAALGKPYVVIHPTDTKFAHALKEVDAQAFATASEEQQVIDIIAYLTTQQ
ncbi:MAG: YtoQ family protein [Bacteroidota bacterium]